MLAATVRRSSVLLRDTARVAVARGYAVRRPLAGDRTPTYPPRALSPATPLEFAFKKCLSSERPSIPSETGFWETFARRWRWYPRPCTTSGHAK